jgi:hypothetical protein
MGRGRFLSLLILALPFSFAGTGRAACLTTLGTDDCGRAWDPQVQAIEHRYLDFPTREVWPRRHVRSKKDHGDMGAN